MIASHLLKFVHFLSDHEGLACELRYIRDRDKREVDFLVVVNNRPWFAVEAKLGDESPSSHLTYFMERLKIPSPIRLLFMEKRT
ncbi:MAG: hypothetical protein KGI80_03935 [Verrucomicrobiota bacterium]|nr:hypothetical protein [Verrucomicrobiota bacterium]